MSLEDHIGDVISKARHGRKVTEDEVAQAAGISSAELAQLESDGTVPGNIDFPGLAPLLQLNPKKLQSLARGWEPEPADLPQWREIRPITTTEGMAVNCYLVWDEVTREAALFDTGWSADPIFEIVTKEDLNLRHLFITHTHSDHIAALEGIRARFPEIKLHSSAKTAPPDQRNRSNDFIHLGSLRITNRDTPGHADDGVTYIIGNFPEDAPSVAIVGDALFAGSMGGARQHLDLAIQKVRDQILSLPAPTLICPGHGPLTTVEQEKAHNPFF